MGATHYNSWSARPMRQCPPSSHAILTLVVAVNGTGSPATLNLSVDRQNGQVETIASG